MGVRIQCPHCHKSYTVMAGVEKGEQTCPNCRQKFTPGSPPPPAAPPAPASVASSAPAPLRLSAVGYLAILAAWVLGAGTVFLIHALVTTGSDGWEGFVVLLLALVAGT